MGSLIGLGGLAASFVIAATTDVPPWINYGVLGAMIVALLVTKQLVPGWIYKEKSDALVAREAQVKELTDKLLLLSESAVPALREATTAIMQSKEELTMRRRRS